MGDAWESEDYGYTWEEVARPPLAARASHRAVVIGGSLLIMGGFNGTKFHNDVWCFDWAAQRVEQEISKRLHLEAQLRSLAEACIRSPQGRQSNRGSPANHKILRSP